MLSSKLQSVSSSLIWVLKFKGPLPPAWSFKRLFSWHQAISRSTSGVLFGGQARTTNMQIMQMTHKDHYKQKQKENNTDACLEQIVERNDSEKVWRNASLRDKQRNARWPPSEKSPKLLLNRKKKKSEISAQSPRSEREIVERGLNADFSNSEWKQSCLCW